MSFAPPSSSQMKPPPIKRLSAKTWTSGTVTAWGDGRTPIDGLKSSGNVYLDQDGTVRPRPSRIKYGPQPIGTVLGEIFEFKNVSGLTSTNWNICLQNVSGTTKAYIAKGEDTTWTACSGKTFDNSANAHFCQVGSKVLIMNGVDNLSYLDISSSTVVPFTALADATAPTVANNGSTSLTTGTTPFTIYYAITANSSVGETKGVSTSLAINTDRDIWNSSTQSLKITWSAVTNARDYNVYMGLSTDGSGAPSLYLIASGINALSFTDDGTMPQDVARKLPTTNSTAGPKVSRGTVINGRPWLVGDKDNPYYVWRGGDYGFELDFTPANGGGYSPVGNGTKEPPIAVKPFRDGKGDFQVTVLCQGTSGRGKRYILTPDSVTIGSITIDFYDVTEDNGQDGTDSPDGIIIYQDSLWYPSRDGFKTTGTKPQLQNVLSTDRVSNTIQPDLASLNSSAMSKCVGLAFEGRLYWAVPNNSTSNNEIWVLDVQRGGAWMKPWSVSVDWMWLYNDNSGNTHFLVLSNNTIYEFAYTALTADDGTAFQTSGASGQIFFSPDQRMWVKLLQIIFVLLRPQGNINFNIAGKTEDSNLQVLGDPTSFVPVSTVAGWGEPSKYIVGWGRIGWSQVKTVPRNFNDATQEVVVPIDEIVQWASYSWNTSTIGVDYNLSDVIYEYIEVGLKDLT